ncbi:hypothetical protein GCM10010123_37150 [Pilimelia anulata]|uniref:Peptidase S1 domain-containing protein n=1 Tax=Pilimelia anulata TaxID=53371 RepID=A0A8J3FB97_9ACTN|nr:trypsin-like serine protease [Pilimelia anulata]GGK03792.1 hypothetical protein GCM10010123_37150 [Pilimelia anulata]
MRRIPAIPPRPADTRPPRTAAPLRRGALGRGTAAVLFAALAALPAATPAAADPGHGIIGGADAADPVPWAAALGNCSASLIAPQWVLTAKHCATAPGAAVAVGRADRTQGERYTVGSVARSTNSDLTLLKLDRAVPNAQPARLAEADPAVGTAVAIFGWGRTCQGNCPATTVLKTAQMTYVRPEKDSTGAPVLYLEKITGSPWMGDSGGPAFVDGVQVGVLWAGNKGKTDAYYSSVANGRAWIRSVAGV